MTRIDDITTAHLDGGNGLATEATVEQFKRACREWLAQNGEQDEQSATEYVWHDGRFDERIRELLGEEVAY